MIKFRAWDSLENKMRYDIGVIEFNAFDKNVSALAFNHHLDDTGYGEVDNSQSEYYNALCFKLMQYTGLKDKNGTEIYEEDIVEVLIEDEEPKIMKDKTYIGIVVYKQGMFDIKNLKNTYLGIIPQMHMSDVNCVFEILGNKYHHPEVLEDKNLLSEEEMG